MEEIKALFQNEEITLLYNKQEDLYYYPDNTNRPYCREELFLMNVVLLVPIAEL